MWEVKDQVYSDSFGEGKIVSIRKKTINKLIFKVATVEYDKIGKLVYDIRTLEDFVKKVEKK